MTIRRRIAVVAALAAATTVGACGGSPSPATSSPATASARTTTSPSSSSAPGSSGPAPVTRTAAELTKALLALQDVPSGFAVDPPSKDEGIGASSKDPTCAAFVRFSNSTKAPGSTASADISFSGGQDGPGVDETLDALGTAARVAALQASYRASIAACRSIDVSVPGVGTSAVRVQTVSPPASGKNPLAARMTFTTGPLKGMEINLVTTGVGDTVLAMTFIGTPPDELATLTRVAVEKATQTLAVPTGT